MSANKAAKGRIKQDAEAVRAIVNAWSPIPSCPEDEYGCLVDRIVSALHRGKAQEAEIVALIESELEEHFGIRGSGDDVAGVAASIRQFWQRRTSDVPRP